MKKFYEKHRDLIWEILRFLLVGGLATLADYITYNLVFYFIIPQGFSWWLLDKIFLAKTAGFTIGVIVNYILSILVVFKNVADKSKSQSFGGFALFVFMGIIGLLISIGITNLGNVIYLLESSFWWNTFVFAFATGIVLIYNYITRKLFLFKPNKLE